MNTFRKVLTVGIPMLLMCAYLEYEERKKKAERRSKAGSLPGHDHPNVEVFRDTIDGREAVRFRGGFDDVMNALQGKAPEEPPALPEDLDVDKLPKYCGGCPGCGFTSFVGEGMWRYRILEKTRERWDNTTTYLARCKKCQALMKATVDHND